MSHKVLFIVTVYGCNSTPSDMWIPKSNIFTNYEEAYEYFLKVSLRLYDEDYEVFKFINSQYKEDDMTDDYVIIENIVQSYDMKRPEGAVISRCIIKS